MPNHVTNKLIFEIEHLDRVLSLCFTGDRFDFSLLIPKPLHMYQGCLSGEDEKDFPCNWLSWQKDNWGTKWNAYNISHGTENGKAFVKFDTAWSLPRPVIVAFANALKIPFEHRYYDEGGWFWGFESWDLDDGMPSRKSKRFKHADDEKPLIIELKGYDPNEDQES